MIIGLRFGSWNYKDKETERQGDTEMVMNSCKFVSAESGFVNISLKKGR
jgi:hypothetical protein